LYWPGVPLVEGDQVPPSGAIGVVQVLATETGVHAPKGKFVEPVQVPAMHVTVTGGEV